MFPNGSYKFENNTMNWSCFGINKVLDVKPIVPLFIKSSWTNICESIYKMSMDKTVKYPSTYCHVNQVCEKNQDFQYKFIAVKFVLLFLWIFNTSARYHLATLNIYDQTGVYET